MGTFWKCVLVKFVLTKDLVYRVGRIFLPQDITLMIWYVLLSSGNPNQNYIFTQITKWTVVILCSSQIENKWRFNLAWGYCKVSILEVKSLLSFCAWLFPGCKNSKLLLRKSHQWYFTTEIVLTHCEKKMF